MNKVIQELQRLFFLPDQGYRSQHFGEEGALTPNRIRKNLEGEPALALRLVNKDNMVRSLVIAFDKGSDWDRLSSLYQKLQNDLGLPAMATSVSAKGGFQLWLSLAECIPLPKARAFLDGIRCKYSDDLPPEDTHLLPNANEIHADMAPSFHEAIGRWSAYIDPALGSIFADAPGLDIAPNMEGQADILSGFESITAEDFQRVFELLQTATTSTSAPLESPFGGPGEAPPLSASDVGSDYRDPQSFLLAVMNSPSATLDQRIKAASALLPHFKSNQP